LEKVQLFGKDADGTTEDAIDEGSFEGITIDFMVGEFTDNEICEKGRGLKCNRLLV
jgi:hypothetical protein